MTQGVHCPKCGIQLASQALGELCANCLLELALVVPADATVLVDGSVNKAPSSGVIIRYFGDYELIDEIARGGMGVVYKARQVSLNRVVALKMILAGDFSSTAMVERFQTEAEAAARLEHPNIVPIYEIGTHDRQHYFSMRFVEGGTLAQALAQKRFDLRESMMLMAKVARAVHHAHQHGILHRDIKPGNILLDATGEPHVSDFGLAKLLEQDSALTQSATVMGTPSYMAPEQAAGDTRDLSTAADIYSLGAVLYELLTGQPPFTGKHALDVLSLVRNQDAASPRSLNPDIPRDLAVICLKCLEKDPAHRYGSAEALAEELDRCLANEPILARRTALPERALKWARRKPVVASLVLAIHLVAGTGLIGILLETRRANAEAKKAGESSRRAESELWNANLNEARAVRMLGGAGARVKSSALLQKLTQRPGLTETQILHLREEAIAQMALVDVVMPTNWIPDGENNQKWGWNKALDLYAREGPSNRVDLCEFPSERVVASFWGPPHTVFERAVISADGRFLAVLAVNSNSRRGGVQVWKIDTKELVLTVASSKDFAVSPDSQTLAFLTSQGVQRHTFAADGKNWRQLGPVPRKLLFSPDSRSIAVLPAARDTVQIWDAETGETRCSFRVSFNPHQIAWHPTGSHLLLGGSRGNLEIRAISDGAETESVGAPVVLDGHVAEIRKIAFTPDGITAVTYSWDHSSIIWDLISARPLMREQRVILGEPSADGHRVLVKRDRPATASVASLIPRTAYRTVGWAGRAAETAGVWVSPNGRLAVMNCETAVGQGEGDCHLWDFSRGVEIARVKGFWAQFSPDSQTLFTFERYGANRVRRYNVSEGALAARTASWNKGDLVYQGRRGEAVNTGTMSPDGRTLTIAATDSVIFLDTRGERPTRSWKAPAHTVALSSDGKWAATGRHHDPSMLRTVSDGQAIRSFPKYSRLRFSPDSQWLAVVTQHEVQIYQLDSLLPAHAPVLLEVGSGAVPPLEFSHDSRMFAVPYNRTNVRLYETATGRELATLSPPDLGQITGGKCLEFTSDGQWLLAAKNDGETVAWDLPVMRRELARLGLDWNFSPSTSPRATSLP